MKQVSMLAWSRAAFAVFGAFLGAGIAGAVAADALGIWAEPVAGACAAFAVVLSAYLFAPAGRLRVAFAALVLGALAAWHIVGDASFPESYGGQAYLPTELPLICTIGAALLALGCATLLSRRLSIRSHGA